MGVAQIIEDIYNSQDVCRVDLMSHLYDVDESGTIYKAFSRPHSTVEVKVSTILAVVRHTIQNHACCHSLSFTVFCNHIPSQLKSLCILTVRIVFFFQIKKYFDVTQTCKTWSLLEEEITRIKNHQDMSDSEFILLKKGDLVAIVSGAHLNVLQKFQRNSYSLRSNHTPSGSFLGRNSP